MPSEKLPPAQPAYVLRGHQAQIHALCFSEDNSRLLTADAHGWLVSWSLAYKRPVASWRAHQKAILGIAFWGGERVISHGRDSRLLVWNVDARSQQQLDTVLPVDASSSVEETRRPRTLHEMTVNTLNFCSFACCRDGREEGGVDNRPLLLALPNTLDSDAIDVFHLPSENRLSTIPAPKDIKTGMVMALGISSAAGVQVMAGYESGHTLVFAQKGPGAPWDVVYRYQAHLQPVLALCISPAFDYYLTSSADAVIAKHPLSAEALTTMMMAVDETEPKPLKLLQTRHSGQQGLSMRSDGMIFATGGWDSRVRVYSGRTMKELAVLKWHKEGCYATAFANVAAAANGKEQQQTMVETQPPPTTTDLDALQSPPTTTVTLSEKRRHKAQTVHWLAAGSKDGKVSLWDVY